ncbi:NACHT domain-containing NTPase [Streptomyces sp. CEV 2-1]|uniref:NACHT domain-containing protein n=1 Tax=Streptomyces sp. CEV 2-1 TaxID=2485153 RepID=UPI00161B7123|nr:AAA family ATPase [Streptomyces sp. CEV 2-1]
MFQQWNVLPAQILEEAADFTGRVWALERIQSWLTDPRAPRVLLVTGERGAGKTKLASRLVQMSTGLVATPVTLALSPGFLAAAHFCLASEVDSLEPDRVYEKLADQLAAQIEGFTEQRLAQQVGTQIHVTISQNIGVAASNASVTGVGKINVAGSKDARRTFDDCIRRPLRALAQETIHPRPFVVLIDALDAALDENVGRNLAQALASELLNAVPGLRLLLTSRPYRRITEAFPEAAIFDLVRGADENVDDIRTYAAGRLGKMPATGGLELAKRIVEVGRGNFLYARRIIDQIESCNPLPHDLADFPLPDELAELDRIPRRWDQLPLPEELPRSVQCLLNAQLAAAKQAPYAIGGSLDLDLSHVYVRQQLGLVDQFDDADEEEEENEAGSRLSLSEEHEGHRLVTDLAEALSESEHLIIAGGPGQGKSTLTLQVVDNLAGSWLGIRTSESGKAVTAVTSEPLLPLRVAARSLVSQGNIPWPVAFTKAVKGELGLLLQEEISPEVFTESPHGFRWLIIIDALDEVASPSDHQRLLGTINHWLTDRRFPHRLLITTRPLARSDRRQLSCPNTASFTLEPFDAKALQKFGNAWFTRSRHAGGSELAQRFLAEVRRARLNEIVSIPLLATVAAVVFEDDPERPLPTRRYELYEQYLAYLFSGRSESFTEQWAIVEQYVSAVPGGRKLAQWLCEQRYELVAHLSVISFEGRQLLLDSACNWVTDQARRDGILPRIIPPNWRTIVAVAATSTGLLAHQGGDLRFLHQSFAEHLAANAHAAGLSATCDPDREDWHSWIESALEGELARSVLICHSRLFPGDGLVEWLLNSDYLLHRVLAGELISGGAAFTDSSLQSLMESFRAWALWVTPGSGHAGSVFNRSLEYASNLFSLESVQHVIAEIVTDVDVPVHRRIMAARVLLKNDTQSLAEAAPALRQVLADSSVDARQRIGAAEVLALANPEYCTEAVLALRTMLSDPDLKLANKRLGAQLLVHIEPGLVHEAAKILCGIVALRSFRDQVFDNSERRSAAFALAELGQRYVEEAVKDLRYQWNSRLIGVTWFARQLSWFGAPYVEEAANACKERLGRANHINVRGLTACVLATLGSHYAEEAAPILRQVLSTRDVSLTALPKAAYTLARIRADYSDQIFAALNEILALDNLSPFQIDYVVRTLVELSSEHQATALAYLRRLLSDREIEDDVRWPVVQAMVSLGSVEETSLILRDVLGDRNGKVSRRRWAATVLAGMGSAYAADVVEQLCQELNRIPARSSDLGMAAGVLIELGPKYASQGAETLLQVGSDPTAGAHNRLQAMQALALFGPHYVTRAAAVVNQLLSNPTAPLEDRRRAANVLARFGLEHATGVAAKLCEVLEAASPNSAEQDWAASTLMALDPRVVGAPALSRLLGGWPNKFHFVRRWAAQSLISLGTEHVGEVSAALQSMLSDIGAAEDDAALISMIYGLGPAYAAEVSAMLSAVVEDAGVKLKTRRWAAQTLMSFGPEYVAEVGAALRSVLSGEGVNLPEYEWELSTLYGLGPAYAAEVSAMLSAVVEDAGVKLKTRRWAAQTLMSFGPEYVAEVGAALRSVLSGEGVNLPEYEWELSTLYGLGPAYAAEVSAMLSAVVEDAGVKLKTRRWAAQTLMSFGPEYVAEVGAALRSVLSGEGVNLPEYEWELSTLYGLGPAYAAEVSAMLSAVVEDAGVKLKTRRWAAQTLMSFGPEYVAEVGAALRSVLSGEGVNLPEYEWELSTLYGLGPAYAAEVSAMLSAVVEDAGVKLKTRRWAAQTLMSFGPEYVAEVGAALREAQK